MSTLEITPEIKAALAATRDQMLSPVELRLGSRPRLADEPIDRQQWAIGAWIAADPNENGDHLRDALKDDVVYDMARAYQAGDKEGLFAALDRAVRTRSLCNYIQAEALGLVAGAR